MGVKAAIDNVQYIGVNRCTPYQLQNNCSNYSNASNDLQNLTLSRLSMGRKMNDLLKIVSYEKTLFDNFEKNQNFDKRFEHLWKFYNNSILKISQKQNSHKKPKGIDIYLPYDQNAFQLLFYLNQILGSDNKTTDHKQQQNRSNVTLINKEYIFLKNFSKRFLHKDNFTDKSPFAKISNTTNYLIDLNDNDLKIYRFLDNNISDKAAIENSKPPKVQKIGYCIEHFMEEHQPVFLQHIRVFEERNFIQKIDLSQTSIYKLSDLFLTLKDSTNASDDLTKHRDYLKTKFPHRNYQTQSECTNDRLLKRPYRLSFTNDRNIGQSHLDYRFALKTIYESMLKRTQPKKKNYKALNEDSDGFLQKQVLLENFWGVLEEYLFSVFEDIAANHANNNSDEVVIYITGNIVDRQDCSTTDDIFERISKFIQQKNKNVRFEKLDKHIKDVLLWDEINKLHQKGCESKSEVCGAQTQQDGFLKNFGPVDFGVGNIGGDNPKAFDKIRQFLDFSRELPYKEQMLILEDPYDANIHF